MNIQPHNPYGVVMAYVLTEGKDDLGRLLAKYGLPSNPSKANINAALRKYGVRFLYDFDHQIVRPYSKKLFDKMSASSFNGTSLLQNLAPSTQYAAQSLASPQKDPNRGDKILTGVSTAISALGTIFGGVQQIRQPQTTIAPPIQYVPQPTTPKAAEDEGDKNKMFLYIGIGVVVLIVGLFAFMKLKK